MSYNKPKVPPVEYRELVYYGSHPEDAMWTFHQMMLNRMSVSGHKYGPVRAKYPDLLHAIDQIKLYLKCYEETHNVDYLADIANFCGMEDMFPSFEDSHRAPTGTEGRVDKKGEHHKGEMAGAGEW